MVLNWLPPTAHAANYPSFPCHPPLSHAIFGVMPLYMLTAHQVSTQTYLVNWTLIYLRPRKKLSCGTNVSPMHPSHGFNYSCAIASDLKPTAHVNHFMQAHSSLVKSYVGLYATYPAWNVHPALLPKLPSANPVFALVISSHHHRRSVTNLLNGWKAVKKSSKS
mgnify:FL=1